MRTGLFAFGILPPNSARSKLACVLTCSILLSGNLFAQYTGIARIDFLNVGVSDAGKIFLSNGQPAAGAGYQIALYYGPAGTRDESALIQVGRSTGFLDGSNAGIFLGGSRLITDQYYLSGTVFAFQARAWGVLSGVPSSYEAVLEAGLAGDTRAEVGKGPVFDFRTTDPGDVFNPPISISRSPDWRGFTITPVPEPSTVALAVLGIGALLLRFRRSI